MNSIIFGLKKGLSFVNRLSDWSRAHRWVPVFIQVSLILSALMFVGFHIYKDWGELRKIDLQIHWGMVGWSFILYGINYGCFLIAWHLLVKRVDKSVGWVQNSFIYSYSHLARFLPSPAWFIASRMMLYGREGMQKRVSLTLTALETILHFTLGLGFYSVLLVDLNSPFTFFYLLGLLPIFALITWPQVFEMRWLKIGEEVHYSRGNLFVISFFLFLTWVTTGFFLNSVILIIGNHQVTVGILDLWRTWIISNLIAYIGSYLLGGVSVLREFSLLFLLGKWFTPPFALGIAVVSRLVMTVAGIFWALLCMGVVKLTGILFQRKRISRDQGL